MSKIEQIFEQLLWSSRNIIIVAVVASIAVATAVFYMATLDVIGIFGTLSKFSDFSLPSDQRDVLRLKLVASVVKVIDIYLLGVIMLIFALGLYELFISKINIAEGSEFAERMLLIRSFDDLKGRLANVVVLMLVVKFFQEALQLPYNSSLDLVYLAVGIVLISGALFLGHKKNDTKH
jgi:uncharacterized membrane protein YqhA